MGGVWRRTEMIDLGTEKEITVEVNPTRSGEVTVKVELIERFLTEAGYAHDCENCQDCLHDGHRCCGCYDGACCHGKTRGEP